MCATTRNRMGLNPLVNVAVGMLMLSPANVGAGKDGAKLAPPLMEYFQSVTLVMWLKQDSRSGRTIQTWLFRHLGGGDRCN